MMEIKITISIVVLVQVGLLVLGTGTTKNVTSLATSAGATVFSEAEAS